MTNIMGLCPRKAGRKRPTRAPTDANQEPTDGGAGRKREVGGAGAQVSGEFHIFADRGLRTAGGKSPRGTHAPRRTPNAEAEADQSNQHVIAMTGTTVKIKFRPAPTPGEAGTLYFQVSRRREVRHIRTAHRVYAAEWDDTAETLAMPPDDEGRRERLQRLRERLRGDRALLLRLVTALDDEGRDYSAREVTTRYEDALRSLSLRRFMQRTIAHLRRLGRTRTAETYQTALNGYMRYREAADIRLDEIDSREMRLFEAWLRAQGLCPNTTSFYMRILRAVYNRAAEQELVAQAFPFRHVYTGIDRTVKRAVPLEVMKRLKAMNLSDSPRRDFARDLFLFSFYTRGMSFVDMACLKKADLVGGVLAYRRRKTGRLISVKWEPCMARIVAKHAARCAQSPYMLPLIGLRGSGDEAAYRRAFYEVNASLKEVGRMLRLSVPLTLYCARHGWASIAQSLQVPLSVISAGMGHTSERTTRIYLSSLDTQVVDQANRLILNAL